MFKEIRPDYYKGCSNLGYLLLSSTGINNLDELCDKECFEVINILELDFYMGNVFKYLWRLGLKGNFFNRKQKVLEDATKAAWYLNTHINMCKIQGDVPKQEYLILLDTIVDFVLNKGYKVV